MNHRYLILAIFFVISHQTYAGGVLEDSIRAMADSFSGAITDELNWDKRPVSVTHEGYTIAFSHQRWRIVDSSVCESYRSLDFSKYAGCANAAKDYFTQICRYLMDMKRSGQRYIKVLNMYCGAANSYVPVVAQIRRADPNSAESKKSAGAACMLARNKYYTTSERADYDVYRRVCDGIDDFSD